MLAGEGGRKEALLRREGDGEELAPGVQGAAWGPAGRPPGPIFTDAAERGHIEWRHCRRQEAASLSHAQPSGLPARERRPQFVPFGVGTHAGLEPRRGWGGGLGSNSALSSLQGGGLQVASPIWASPLKQTSTRHTSLTPRQGFTRGGVNPKRQSTFKHSFWDL